MRNFSFIFIINKKDHDVYFFSPPQSAIGKSFKKLDSFFLSYLIRTNTKFKKCIGVSLGTLTTLPKKNVSSVFLIFIKKTYEIRENLNTIYK